MDYALLKAEIASGPLAAELAPLVGKGDFNAVAAAVNRADRPGYIPRRHVVVAMARHAAVYALARYCTRFNTMPTPYGGGPVAYGLYALFASILLIADSDVELKAAVADIVSGYAKVSLQLVPQDFRDYLLTGETKINRIEEAFGYGSAVSGEQCRVAVEG